MRRKKCLQKAIAEREFTRNALRQSGKKQVSINLLGFWGTKERRNFRNGEASGIAAQNQQKVQKWRSERNLCPKTTKISETAKRTELLPKTNTLSGGKEFWKTKSPRIENSEFPWIWIFLYLGEVQKQQQKNFGKTNRETHVRKQKQFMLVAPLAQLLNLKKNFVFPQRVAFSRKHGKDDILKKVSFVATTSSVSLFFYWGNVTCSLFLD